MKNDMHHSEINSQQQRAYVAFLWLWEYEAKGGSGRGKLAPWWQVVVIWSELPVNDNPCSLLFHFYLIYRPSFLSTNIKASIRSYPALARPFLAIAPRLFWFWKLPRRNCPGEFPRVSGPISGQLIRPLFPFLRHFLEIGGGGGGYFRGYVGSFLEFDDFLIVFLHCFKIFALLVAVLITHWKKVFVVEIHLNWCWDVSLGEKLLQYFYTVNALP